MRLPRKHSMNERTDFQSVRTNGLAKVGRFVVVSTLENPELLFLKIGIITTRKVGKAHDRNLMRRRVRALLQKHGHRLTCDRRFLVTIPRHGAATASFADLETDWLKQLKRLGILAAMSESP